MVDDVEKQVSEPADEAPAEQSEATAPEDELAKAKALAADYLDQWRRTAAEFANYRKRMDREREDMTRFASALLIGKLLPVLDDFERAMATLPADLRHLSWVEGVFLIQRKMEATLEAEGVTRMTTVGQAFDPQRHEAIMREETTAYPDGQIIAELQRGYEMHGRVLRPALVKVASAPVASPPSPEPDTQPAPVETEPQGPASSDEEEKKG
ncbi:MAG: nucleotide exchange factor GrpE [Anaerolineae bacterium]